MPEATADATAAVALTHGCETSQAVGTASVRGEGESSCGAALHKKRVDVCLLGFGCTISTDSWANGRVRPQRTPCGFLVVAWSLSIIIDKHSPSPFTHFLVLAKGFSVACHL